MQMAPTKECSSAYSNRGNARSSDNSSKSSRRSPRSSRYVPSRLGSAATEAMGVKEQMAATAATRKTHRKNRTQPGRTQLYCLRLSTSSSQIERALGADTATSTSISVPRASSQQVVPNSRQGAAYTHTSEAASEHLELLVQPRRTNPAQASMLDS